MLSMIHLVLLMIICVCSGSPKRILYLPLDERFTTRDLLLNLGKLTSFIIETPSKQVLSKWKTSADLEKIDEFIDERVEHADLLLISAEMYLYGGLIASRISNDTTVEIEKDGVIYSEMLLQILQIFTTKSRVNFQQSTSTF